MTLFNVAPARRIASGFFPDPTICERPEGGYLMVNSSFEYFPGLPVWESDDGEHWEPLGCAMDRPSQFPYDTMGNSQGIYAPTLRWHNGTYYLIVTNVNRGNMILTTRDPRAGWSEPIWVEGWPGIDPSLFFDDDGTAYICGNEGGGGEEIPGIYLAKIDPDAGRVLTGRTHICGGITGSNPEGPHLYKRNGMYYLMWAEGGTESGHMENIARADNPFGPYEMCPGNPLITNRSTHLTLQAIGHCDCAHFDADRTLMVFHGTRNNAEYPAQGWIGREPYAVWFDWKDGWPCLADQSYDTPLEGDDSANEGRVAWITPGIDRDGWFHVIAETAETAEATEPATITVRAVNQEFSPLAGPPMIGTRQTCFTFCFTATLADPTTITTGEAGIAAYANADHYLAIAVHAADGETDTLRVAATAHNAGLVSVLGTADVPAHQPITLIMRGDDYGYTCFVTPVTPAGSEAAAPAAAMPLGTMPGKVLSFSNAGGFTGTLLGVYAHGTGAATFTGVTYQPAVVTA